MQLMIPLPASEALMDNFMHKDGICVNSQGVLAASIVGLRTQGIGQTPGHRNSWLLQPRFCDAGMGDTNLPHAKGLPQARQFAAKAAYIVATRWVVLIDYVNS